MRARLSSQPRRTCAWGTLQVADQRSRAGHHVPAGRVAVREAGDEGHPTRCAWCRAACAEEGSPQGGGHTAGLQQLGLRFPLLAIVEQAGLLCITADGLPLLVPLPAAHPSLAWLAICNSLLCCGRRLDSAAGRRRRFRVVRGRGHADVHVSC